MRPFPSPLPAHRLTSHVLVLLAIAATALTGEAPEWPLLVFFQCLSFAAELAGRRIHFSVRFWNALLLMVSTVELLRALGNGAWLSSVSVS
ncbi:MAG: hypothetical protein N2515_07555, partial [Deltaproteobacteria bacterium]|nr:hypothetical protein [Deltaproteobacteria bacterium]